MIENQQIQMMRLRQTLAERLRRFKEGPRTVGGYYWTVPAIRTAANGGRGFYQSGAGLWVDPEGSTFDLRLSPAADFLEGRLSWTTGYATDDEGVGDTLKPIVARLPRGRGFLAGWTMGEGMCATLDGRRFDDASEAAYYAHQLAEQDAQAEAEAEAVWRAEQEHQELTEALRGAEGLGWGMSPEGYC
jgi:hypothetical protein